jgi:hypothetical protein
LDDEQKWLKAKTKPAKQSVADSIESLPDAQTRADCLAITKLMEAATKRRASVLDVYAAPSALRIRPGPGDAFGALKPDKLIQVCYYQTTSFSR